MGEVDFLPKLITEYYKYRGYSRPDFWESMGWVATEIGESYEVKLSQGDWIRNNPETKPEYSLELLGEELGDAIMMLIVAGLVEGVNPIEQLVLKLKGKMNEG